jgi:hypothetical protein
LHSGAILAGRRRALQSFFRAARLSALLSFTLRPALGAEPPLTVAGSDQTGELATHERAHVRFTARSLVLDPQRRELTLEGDTRLSTGRYHVRGERLTLSWPKNELLLAGPARVSWCACEPAPAALRFERLTLRSAGTLELSQPVLELGGVPVLWAPWLRIEPPDRFGLLPLELAWRGDDGLLVGGGVHVPVVSAGPSYVQLSAGAYTAGGFAMAAAVATPTSASWARWERLSGTGLWLDSRGSAGAAEGPALAWAADAIRGRRGVLGTLELGSAARSSDRARVALSGSTHGLVYGLVARADTLRGGGLSSVDAWGPELSVGYGAALAGWGSVELSLAAQQLYTPAQYVSLAAQGAKLQISRPVAVFSVLADAEVETMTRLGRGGWRGGDVSGRLRLGLPLARSTSPRSSFGSASAHWLEPFLDASVGALITSGRPDFGYFSAVREGAVASAVAGVATHHGVPSRRSATRLELRAGAVLGDTDRWYPGLSWQGGANGELARASSDGALTTLAGDWLSATRLELGRDGGLELGGYLEGRSSGDAPLAGLLDPIRRRRLWTPWFASAGWSSGGELRVPVGQHWRAALAADVDVTNERWLARSALVEYLAKCGCLSVTASVQQRAGRGGLDASLSLELDP